MTGTFLSWAVDISLFVVSVALLMIILRFLLGPTLADRVVALDTMVAAAMGVIALIAIRSGFSLFIDIAVVLGLVSFLSTVAFARFLLIRGAGNEERADPAKPGQKRKGKRR